MTGTFPLQGRNNTNCFFERLAMRKVYSLSTVDESRCLGDKHCENACPTGAIKVVNKKAEVDEAKCAACLNCFDVCPHGAIRMVDREVLIRLYTDPTSVDQTQLEELCRKAMLSPDSPICTCTLTRAGEVAAAILKGAHNPEQVAVATGIRTACALWCMAPLQRLLKAHLGEIEHSTGYQWYPADIGLWNINQDVSKKYPEYFIDEDQDLYDDGIIDNLFSG